MAITELWEHQKSAIEIALKHNLLLADQCGLGKTLVAIETAQRLRATGMIEWQRPILIICNNKAKQQWLEMLLFQGVSEQSIMVCGKAGRGLPTIIQGQVYIIIHHEAITYITPQLRKTIWSMIVIDEAHRYKNRKTKRWVAVRNLTAARVLELTGTPMEKSPHNLWALLHMLDQEEFNSYWKWESEYIDIPTNYLGYKDWSRVRVKNPAALALHLAPYFLRRTRQEVAPDFPIEHEYTVPIKMEEHQRGLYKKIKQADDFLLEIDKKEILILNTISQITKLLQVSSYPPCLDFNYPSGKILWLEDWLADNPDEPVMIFSRFRPVVQYIAGKYQCDMIIGGHSGIGEDFLAGKTNIVAATIAAGGESLNFQRATTAIFVDQDWSMSNMIQAKERVIRLNDPRPKTIIHLQSINSVDRLVQKALVNKWSTSDLVYEYIKEVQSDA